MGEAQSYNEKQHWRDKLFLETFAGLYLCVS